ncbi:DNA adenine methylase [Nitratiruptor sp. YY08-26]|uniref:DNA adenine methylase n=1 Tax=unclassified Nitratiruptor TaxID=2624044 RepID=UPI001916BB82|nr:MULTISPECIES: DNA adenine methylase [unclassified Nitratiruptor]BCD61359.1 DNA adenine methylase [Nitratiruptor sp. YY08-13]BCD65292.1 DNA adenine methylase [Nitratiruptor sp. YY08-26]
MVDSVEKKSVASPFIKWVGGKRGLLTQLLPLIPRKFNNYFEPFVGGGVLFFELFNLGLLHNKKVYLFDRNEELINTYKIVQNKPDELLEKLKEFQENHSKEFYYEMRELDRREDLKNLDRVLRAARFIYLNRTCFNGLYRVNKKEHFNVPIGRYKNPKIYDEDLIMNASQALQGVIIKVADFSEVLQYAQKEDFIYFDPPYYPLNETSKFTSYTDLAFLENKQKRLFDVYEELDKRGCFVMESNSDTKFIKDLYKEYTIDTVYMHRFISKKEGRGKISEALVRDYI